MSSSSIRILASSAAICLTLWTGTVLAGTLVRLDRPAPYDLQVAGFELTRPAEVDLEAVGIWSRGDGSWVFSWLGVGDNEPMSVSAWLIDADTRELVWAMDAEDSARQTRSLRKSDEHLSLAPGRYELYLFSGYGWVTELEEQVQEKQKDRNWWAKLWNDEGHRIDELREDLAECYVELSSSDISSRDIQRFEPTGDRPDALIQVHRMENSQLARHGFELSAPGTVRVSSLIERPERRLEPADFGWIVDEATREVVWKPHRSRSYEPGGGGEKNVLVDETVELPQGRYILYFGTDDTHSFEQFNVLPPHDPFNWGITLLPGDGFDRATFSAFVPESREPVLIESVRVGDGEFFEQGFRLSRAGSLHVLSLGEFDDDDDQFLDSAWIVNGPTGETVWEMTRDNTMGAGGAGKNRMYDGHVELDAGDYVLYYVSDGSHSFRHWNNAAPFLPEAWGVRVRPGPDFDPATLELLDRAEIGDSPDILARIVRVGNDALVRQRFTLDRAARVEIYAQGEGMNDEMYDYGYLSAERNGSRIWKMEYDETRHAGGADKNRMVRTEIELEAGAYEVVYRSDDSHSFHGWNARAPHDPMGWGITVRLVDGS